MLLPMPGRHAARAAGGGGAENSNLAVIATAAQPGGGLHASVAVALHNSYRAIHSAPPLAWSDSLAAQAAGWASGCSFAHDPDNLEAGENVFACNWLEEPSDILRAAVTVW